MQLTLTICSLVFLTALTTADEDDHQELKQMLHDTCVAETGTTDDKIQDARNGKFADDNAFKCYLKCYLAQVSFIDEDTWDIDTEAVLAMTPPKIYDDVVVMLNKCGTIKGADICDTAYKTNMCWQGVNPIIYSNILN